MRSCWHSNTGMRAKSLSLDLASFDLHGSLSRRIIDNLDMLSAFRTAPHIDREETAQRACDMLIRCLDHKIRPVMVWAPIPVLMPGERSSTVYEPAKHSQCWKTSTGSPSDIVCQLAGEAVFNGANRLDFLPSHFRRLDRSDPG